MTAKIEGVKYADKTVAVTYDGDLNLSIGDSRMAKKWKNQTMKWSAFLDRLAASFKTSETVEEYHAMTKEQQADIKDVGGFVGGFLKGGKRGKGTIQNRGILSLDADSATVHLWDDFKLLFDNAAAVYTTHSHTAEDPRYRILVPLSRAVTPDEYIPLVLKLADLVGSEHFDPTTTQPERLMYWPSHSRDADPFFDYQDAPFLDPDTVLNQYDNWKNTTEWPTIGGETIQERTLRTQGDPRNKGGIVGAFCEAYSITEAIEAFLSDVYEETGTADRFTYLKGSAHGGLVVYDDDLHAYSNHGTDPAGGMSLHAFDLVRIHKFGEYDVDVDPGTDTTALPSHKRMVEFVHNDPRVQNAVKNRALGSAASDFDVWDEEESDPAPAPVKTRRHGDITVLDVEDKREWMVVTKKGAVKINPFLLAEQVAAEVPLLDSGDEFLRYDPAEGIWKDDAERVVRSHVVRKLQELATSSIVRDTVTLARDMAYNGVGAEDANLDKLVLENGIYTISTDSFSPGFEQQLFARTKHPIHYDPEADCPTFTGFLEEVVGPENVEFVFEWFGYNLYRVYRPVQQMLFIHGPGGTGKSTLVNTLTAFIGKDATAAVTLKDLMTERFAKAGLYKKNANMDTDAKPQYLADGATLKMLTGDDRTFADRKNREPISFYNYAKLTFAMNELPPMRDFSGGLKRRMLILEMKKKITDDIKERFPESAFMDELPGIFNRAMDALRRVLDAKEFTVSETMAEQVERWEAGNDVVALFIEDECKVGDDHVALVKELYNDYANYCRTSGYKAMSRSKFNQRMEELGYTRTSKRIEGSVSKAWNGIAGPSDELL